VAYVVQYARAVQGPAPWPPPGLPAPWRKPIARCLAIDPAKRLASGVELLELVLDLDLLAARPGAPPRAAPVSLADRDLVSVPSLTDSDFVSVPSLTDSDFVSVPSLTDSDLVSVPSLTDSDFVSVPSLPGDAVAPAPSSQERTSAPVRGPQAKPPVPVSPKRKGGKKSAAPPTPPPSRARWVVAVLLVLLLALGVGGVVAVQRGATLPAWLRFRGLDRGASSAASSASAQVRAPHPPPASSVCPALCCGGSACAARRENARGCAPEGGHCRTCPSERTCIPGPCEGHIASDGVWLLRVAGVTANGKDMIPRPKACLRHPGAGDEAWLCQAGGNADTRASRLRATTAELTHDGIDLSVARPDGSTESGAGIHHPAIGVAALCRGLNFRFTGGDGVAYAVTLFLDDAEDAPAP